MAPASAKLTESSVSALTPEVTDEVTAEVTSDLEAALDASWEQLALAQAEGAVWRSMASAPVVARRARLVGELAVSRRRGGARGRARGKGRRARRRCRRRLSRRPRRRGRRVAPTARTARETDGSSSPPPASTMERRDRGQLVIVARPGPRHQGLCSSKIRLLSRRLRAGRVRRVVSVDRSVPSGGVDQTTDRRASAAVARRGEAYLLARSASADFSAEAPADAATHTPTTDEGRWVLDGVLTPPPAPAGGPAETTSGACAVSGETAAMGSTAAAGAGSGGAAHVWRRLDAAERGEKRWRYQTRLTPATSGITTSGYGRRVAIDGGRVFASAADRVGSTGLAGTGAAYSFAGPPPPPSPPPPSPSPPPSPPPPSPPAPRRHRHRHRHCRRRRRRRRRRHSSWRRPPTTTRRCRRTPPDGAAVPPEKPPPRRLLPRRRRRRR